MSCNLGGPNTSLPLLLTWLDLVQQGQARLCRNGVDVQVLDVGHGLGQAGQLVEVRGKERKGVRLPRQVPGRRTIGTLNLRLSLSPLTHSEMAHARPKPS